MDNAYGYDVVSNVLSVVNKAAIPEKGKAGGQMRYNYTYDALYRLSTASGTYKGADNKAASYTLSMGYDNMHRITSKKQHLSQTGVQFEGTLNAGYELAYTYGKDAGRKFQLDNVRDINYRTEETPTEGMNINNGHKYTYDLNGNLVYINTSRVKRDGKEDEKATEQKYRWDEDNRLMVLSDNGKTSRYTYNAAGERIMKSYGTMEGGYINGAPQGITFHETDNFTLYPASIISINKNRFTKHYFLGDKRIASRIGTGMFNNVYGRNGSYVTAGQQDYAERMNQIQTQKEAYYKKVGVAPGVPTEKGAYGDPENTGVGYNAVLTELGNHDVPQGWIQTPHPNTTPGTNPGAPVSWNDPTNPDDPQAGYGYIPNDTTKEETFFYHSDHLGSTSYITDDKANITQYDAYLPYGELLVDEHSSSEDMPYKFNGKQFDEETGLYYYGARYMNPMASIWYGVDPMYNLDFSVSTYIFCHNNPIKNKDINGMYGTEEEAKHAAKMYGANYSYAKDKKQWYVALDESKRGAYKSGGTLTRHFGEDDMKITYRHSNTFTVNYFGKEYDFPDDPVINPSQIPENFYFWSDNQNSFRNSDGTKAFFNDIFMSKQEIEEERAMDITFEITEMLGADLGGGFSGVAIDASDMSDQRLIPAAKYEKWRFKFPQRTIQEKIKFNNHKNLLKEYKQLEFIEREVGVSFMSTEEYTRLNSLKEQLGK